jgi:putative transposase
VEELRILLGRVAYRTVQPYGIEFESLRYNCAELAPLRTRLAQQADKRVKLKYQPSDLSRIYVYDPFENRYVAVPALAQEYTQGLSLWKHRVVRHFVLAQQRQVDLAALGAARRRIQEIIEASLRRKDLHARTRVARWQTESRSAPTSPTPDALEAPGAAPEAPLPALTVPAAEELAQLGWSVNYDLPIPQAGVKSDDC